MCPVYWDIPTGGCVHGIFACLPYEHLHLFYLGLMKYLLHALYNFCKVPECVTDWYKMVCCGQSPAEAGDSESITDEDCDNYSNDGHGNDDEEISNMDSRVPNEDGSIHHKTRPTVAFKKL